MLNITAEINTESKAGGFYLDAGWSTENIVVIALLLAVVVPSLLFEVFFSIPYSKFASKEERYAQPDDYRCDPEPWLGLSKVLLKKPAASARSAFGERRRPRIAKPALPRRRDSD